MARRFSAPYQSEPVSSLATWARNLALFSVIAVVVSILIVRFGFLEMKPALATFFGALACAALSILVNAYMDLLKGSHQDANLEGVMCRTTVSVYLMSSP